MNQRRTSYGGSLASWITVREAAERASVSTRTIKRWIAVGLLPAQRLPSPMGRGHLRIRLGDLEALIARGAK
jgi:excisionase family DNA binding protein